MFEFLFKRPGDNKSGDKPAGQGPQPSASGAAAPGAAAQSGAGASSSATAARAQQAEKLSQVQGDEAAAVEFILQCEFSELRLTAAEFVHSPAALERVHTAMRNTDRRVAKLMQSRLDAHRHHEAEHRRAEAALESARSLLKDALLTPNHVADLDRKWAVIAAPELQEEFQNVRAALGQRLEAQVQLQRAMIDRLAALRQLSAGVAAGSLPAAELAARLEVLAQEQAAALQAPEHASLPRGLGAEFGVEHQKLLASLHAIEAGQSALAARSAFLELQGGKPVAELDADTLRKEWKALPALPQEREDTRAQAAELQRRFEAVLASLPQPEPRKPKETRPAPEASAPAEARGEARSEPRKPKGADQHFLDTMDAMEAALQQGSLGTAAELDKTLKDAREKGMRLTPAQSDRLAHVRAELKRLSDWARWGGNVSREELIKNVETLATQNLAMSELAKKVGSMRERWKALDSLSGAAPKSLWERFDAACSAAYAPAAAHFRQLADERHANAARAEKLVEEARAEIARLQSGEADWKHVAGTVQRLRLGWSHLGAIDRKEKKRLDGLFTDALNVMQAPLEEQRKGEMAEREAIIEEAAAIDPHDRHAIDTMRALQQRWQEHARALPLERKSEQALWQRFRAVCDEVFQRRKESMHEADIERRAHEAAKEAISARLEAAAPDATPATMGKLLREAQAEWQAIGPVPRAHEARVEKRYHAAVALVQQHADQVRRAAGVAQANQLRDKLRLVQELEQAVAGAGKGDGADWEARWSALPVLDAELERTLRARFDAAVQAFGGDRAAYARLLERNRDILLHDLLRMEIGAGIDSGPEFARERLKLQVEVLQSSLKSGQKNGTSATPAAQLRALLALPALADARTATRIEQLSMRLAKEGK
ncbi:DUF349 domain-containing protein [Herbaspirillum sp. SJZ107]|uniref:DUF349 domain-containing protein n=1 Tax=Herbaspirillum sp. SJZ107 TaxID=2572881 RepID=UPI00115046F9|nr:DUF349 domain-containing protein [Herbaspirillum sp. SJZ107]TQK08191.1 uncharacterized protein DUF349 [Herbaspirillum sp. SJZ107]